MRYHIKAIQEGKGVIALEIDAPTEQEAAGQVARKGLALLTIKPTRSLVQLPFGQGGRFPLMLFNQELLALLQAGLNLVEALEALAEKERSGETRKTLDGVLHLLREGKTLSAALQAIPQHFPPLYIATVRASEKTGGLAEAISRYVAYQAQLEIIRKKLITSSIYPVLLISVGILVTLFMMVYVVPKFSQVYEDVGAELPFLSRILIQWGKLLAAHAGIFGASFLGIGALALYGATRPQTRHWVTTQMWKIPAVGERMKIYQLARFYRTLGMLLRGGIAIVPALEMVSGLLAAGLRDGLQNASRAIREGQPISAAMEHNNLTTPVALRMLRVGEQTGSMGEMMERTAAFYDEELSRWVDWFTRLFEPILMALIGLMVGGIVVLMYIPIFELAGSIQ